MNRMVQTTGKAQFYQKKRDLYIYSLVKHSCITLCTFTHKLTGGVHEGFLSFLYQSANYFFLIKTQQRNEENSAATILYVYESNTAFWSIHEGHT